MRETALVATLAAGFGLAFRFGLLAARLRLLGKAHYALLSLGRTDHESDTAIETIRARGSGELQGPL